MGSAPSEVAPAVSKVRHRACGDTRLDPKVKELTTTNTNRESIDTATASKKAKMARGAEDRAPT